MRANDAWKGFPNDVFQFTQLQCTAARCLGVGFGTYFHHATSFHLYETDLEKVDQLIDATDAIRVCEGVGDKDGYTWRYYQERARHLFYGQLHDEALTTSEAWLSDALRKKGIAGQW
jgi:hypothetical protein